MKKSKLVVQLDTYLKKRSAKTQGLADYLVHAKILCYVVYLNSNFVFSILFVLFFCMVLIVYPLSFDFNIFLLWYWIL